MNLDDDFDPIVISKKPLPRNVERIFNAGSLETFRFDDAKEMLGYLRQLIRGESPLWLC